MPATVLCARANALIDHGGHKYGANSAWWCPGFDQVLNTVTVVGSKPAELPVENELIDGAWYNFPNGAMQIYRENAEFHGKGVSSFYRMAPVARYEALAPEVKEPRGIGAAVHDALLDAWVRVDTSGACWVRGRPNLWGYWSDIQQPVIVLSEGVEL